MVKTRRPPGPFDPRPATRTVRNTVGLRAPWKPGQSGNPRGGAVSLFSLATRDGSPPPRQQRAHRVGMAPPLRPWGDGRWLSARAQAPSQAVQLSQRCIL